MATEQPVPERVDAWLVMWRCLCSDVRAEKAALPEQCPGHAADRIDKPEQIREALVRFVGVHQCPDSLPAKCPAVAS